MTFVLDTNILSELLKANARIVTRFDAVPESDSVVTTTISRYEILKGRYASILKAADRRELLVAQQRLLGDEERLARITILPITEAAGDHFERMRGEKRLKRIGRNDLLIACIALAHNATLVSRNTKDFAHVPGLRTENRAD